MSENLRNRFVILTIMPVLLIMFAFFESGKSGSIIKQPFETGNERLVFPYIKMLDTIHYLGNEYIVIHLDRQVAVLHRRDEDSLEYPVSSGNDKISEGMLTPPGFYTVQTKLEVGISRQFNNAELLNWIGFNGNIGFHGLKATGYYAHLGKRPSSHGCVRIGRESGKDLYTRVQRGTPVIVQNEDPAIVVAFSDFSQFDPLRDFLLDESSTYVNRIVRDRLDNLKKGKALRNNEGRLFVDGKTVMRPRGFSIGSLADVPDRQLKPLYIHNLFKFSKDNLKVAYHSVLLPDTLSTETDTLSKSNIID